MPENVGGKEKIMTTIIVLESAGKMRRVFPNAPVVMKSIWKVVEFAKTRTRFLSVKHTRLGHDDPPVIVIFYTVHNGFLAHARRQH